MRIVWITHTTEYRGGSAEFALAARTLAEEKRREGHDVRVEPVRRKSDFVAAFDRMRARDEEIDELHFIGHSGMYGIMFGSTSWPEQLSPHEWRTLSIPFAPGATAHFHACRTARWFAPFFARTFGVTTYGHHLYTTVSRDSKRFAWAGPRFARRDAPLYVIACRGRKSDGPLASLRKYVGHERAAPMLEFKPTRETIDRSYDRVADLYDRAFADIRVRRAEYDWITRAIDSLPSPPRVLDLGAGNGALLRALAPSIAEGVGVDASAAMIARAKAHRNPAHLEFEAIDAPALPFESARFDLVVSLLSFRYLDWDPVLREIDRVLAPGGRLLVIDMVEKPASVRDLPLAVASAFDHVRRRARHPAFVRDLEALTTAPEWREMVRENPIRAEHEYRWYFESRFPGRRIETLTVSRAQRVVAFDSGPKSSAWRIAPLSFP